MRGRAGALIALALWGMVGAAMRPAGGPADSPALIGGSGAIGTAVVRVALVSAEGVTVRPADGAVLARAPAEVAVSLPDGVVREAHLSVADAAGAPVTSGTASTLGAELAIPVSIARNGTYLVAYHFVLADGRVISGVTRFAVGQQLAGGGNSMGHSHSGEPINLVLTAVAAISVIALLFIMFRRPSIPTG